jgi:hypothetical protein
VRSASQPARQILEEPQQIVPTTQARWNVLKAAIRAGSERHAVAAGREEPIEHEPQDHQEEVHETTRQGPIETAKSDEQRQ